MIVESAVALHEASLENRCDPPQYRALLYVFDAGTGMGHLRRVCRIARALQGRFACLIITGHRGAASWFVPAECEYVHLPSWDSLLASKAQYWGRQPFLRVSQQEAVQLRKKMLQGIVGAFQPQALFVDHLPLGAYDELENILQETTALKYLVTRGVQNETENLEHLVFGGKARDFLQNCYDRVFVTIDPEVFHFERAYSLPAEIRDKSLHTGYVIDEVSPAQIAEVRRQRNLPAGTLWVVASAGGGQKGEALVERCIQLARQYPEIEFDIVQGPRSNRPWPETQEIVLQCGNMRLHRETPNMPYFHAAADLVICSAGYNSLLEALQGEAKILCFPYRRDTRDEQYSHAKLLQKFVDLAVSTDLSDVAALFALAVAELKHGPARDNRRTLMLNGAAVIERAAVADMEARKSTATFAS